VAPPGRHAAANIHSLQSESLYRLAGDFGDQLEVFIQMEHCSFTDLGGSRDEQIGD
jgi:hypothetical protein